MRNVIRCAARNRIINSPVPSAQYEVIESKRPWLILTPQVRMSMELDGASAAAVGVRRFASSATD